MGTAYETDEMHTRRLILEGEKAVEAIEQALNNLKETKRDLGYPTEQDKWQRVINEGYLCKFWDDDSKFPNKGTLITADRRGGSWLCENGKWHANCEVLREKGVKQPYFQGDDIPEVATEIVVYLADGKTAFYNPKDWSNVVAYIEV